MTLDHAARAAADREDLHWVYFRDQKERVRDLYVRAFRQGAQWQQERLTTLPTCGKYRQSSLAELPDWLDRLRAGMERHQATADLFMQELTGMEAWADMIRTVMRAGTADQDTTPATGSTAATDEG